MSAQHTPLVVSYDESGGYDCMTAAFEILQGDRALARLDLADYGQDNCKPPQPLAIIEAEAHARLFAAAPELLAALEGLLADWERCHGKVPDDHEARAAIAKATAAVQK